MELIIENGILTKAIVEEENAHVVIPEGCTEIADKAFYQNENIAKVTLPSSLRKIGDEAFYHCYNLREINLESVTFPDTLREIGEYAFQGCKKLTSLDLKNTEIINEVLSCLSKPEIGYLLRKRNYRKFYMNDYMRNKDLSITLPYREYQKHYGPQALLTRYDEYEADPDSFEHITLNEKNTSADFYWDGWTLHLPSKIKEHTITSLGYYGAYTNRGYKELYLPERLKIIDGNVEIFDPEMEVLHLPASLKTIEGNPFRYCKELHTIEIASDNPYFTFEDGALYMGRKLIAVLPGGFHKETLTIREGTRSIGGYAIANLHDLKEVIVPEGCSLGDYKKFYNCPNLETVRVPRALKNKDISIWFENCPKAAVYVEKKEEVELFYYFELYGSDYVVLGNTPDGSYSQKRIILDQETASDDFRYDGDTLYLPRRIFPGNNISDDHPLLYPNVISGYAVELIKDVWVDVPYRTLHIPEGVRGIKNDPRHAVFSQEVETIYIPASLNYINSNPFLNCENLHTLMISPENSVFEIVDGVLYDKENSELVAVLPKYFHEETLTIREGTRSIGDYAIANLPDLKQVILPEGCSYFKDRKFYNCPNLETVRVPSEFKNKDTSGWFWNCLKAAVHVEKKDVELIIENGILTKAIVEEEDEHVIIPEGCTEIADRVFERNKNVIKVTLPSSLRKIGDRAFDSCYNLQEINLESVEEIGKGAFSNNRGLVNVTLGPITIMQKGSFRGCDNLEAVVFPDTLREIGEGAFENCKKLTGVDLKNTVKIRDRAFSSCYNLQEINLELVEAIGEGAFSNNRGLVNVILGPITIMQKDNFRGCDNLESVVLPDKLREIGEGAFAYCKKLTSIELKNIVKIGHHAFSSCPNLEAVVFSDSLREIGEGAFENCKKLTSIDLKNTFKIGGHAFDYCSNLQEAVMHHVREFGDTKEMPFNKCPNISIDVYELWNKYKWPWPKNPVDVCYYFDKDGWLCLGKALDEFDRKGSAVIERGEEGILHLPGKIVGYPLSSIRQYGLDLSVPYQTLHIPEGVREIIGGAEGPVFRPEVEIIHIPTSLNKIVNPFINCENLHTLRISPYNKRFELVDGVLYDKKDAVLVAVLPGVFHNDTLVVREGTRSIGRYAIANLPELKQVIVPEEVVYEAEECFYNCPNLETVIVSKAAVHFSK